jgi:hypothetical protein
MTGGLLVVIKGERAHFFYALGAFAEGIYQHRHKAGKEDEEGDDGVNGDPIDGFHGVFDEFKHEVYFSATVGAGATVD